MTEKINDGGSAFARPVGHGDQHEMAGGMSLRDWFAGMALQGRLANTFVQENTCAALDRAKREGVFADPPEKYEAQWAYKIADAMLAEKEKGK